MQSGQKHVDIDFTLPSPWDSYRKKMQEASQRPTDEVLVAAFAAHRINGGYHKTNVYENVTTPHGDELCVIKKQANKLIVTNHLMGKGDPLEIIPEDVDMVEKAREHFKKYTLRSLGGESSGLNDFEQNVYSCMLAETVGRNEYGIVSYIPALMDRELNDKQLKKTLKKDYSESKHQGKVKDKLTIVATIINKKFLSSWNRYVYQIGDGENLYSFWHASGALNINDTYEFDARVKSHGVVYGRNEEETQLNYVKFRSIR